MRAKSAAPPPLIASWLRLPAAEQQICTGPMCSPSVQILAELGLGTAGLGGPDHWHNTKDATSIHPADSSSIEERISWENLGVHTHAVMRRRGRSCLVVCVVYLLLNVNAYRSPPIAACQLRMLGSRLRTYVP